MNMRDARKRIWERAAATVRADIDNADWILDESEDPEDQKRLLQACKQVAHAIRKIIARSTSS